MRILCILLERGLHVISSIFIHPCPAFFLLLLTPFSPTLRLLLQRADLMSAERASGMTCTTDDDGRSTAAYAHRPFSGVRPPRPIIGPDNSPAAEIFVAFLVLYTAVRGRLAARHPSRPINRRRRKITHTL